MSRKELTVHQRCLLSIVRENIEEYWGEGAFANTFLQDHSGCVPDEYIGEDIYGAIHNKFYAVFSAIARVVEKETGMAFLFTTVSPSYEDITKVILHGYYRGQEEVILLVERIKAWNLWWLSQEKMEESLECWYEEALQAALAYSPSGLKGLRLYEFTILVRNGEQEYLPRQAVAARSLEQARQFAQDYTANFYDGAQWDEGYGAWYPPQGYPAWRLEDVKELDHIIAPIASGEGTAVFKVGPALETEVE